MDTRGLWLGKARRLVARRNLACWLDYFIVAANAICLLGALTLLVMRVAKVFPGHAFWISFTGCLLIAAMVSIWLARRKFFNMDHALAQLDAAGRLHNRLTAAQAGVGHWPEAREVRDSAKWNWKRLIGSVSLSVGLLLCGLWLPLPVLKRSVHAAEPPLAIAQVQSWIQELERSQLVEENALQSLRDEVSEIQRVGPDNWYNESSLEASDTLRDKVEQSLKTMQSNFEGSQEALGASLNSAEAQPDELTALNSSLQKAVQGLEAANLPLNKQMLSDLKKLDLTKSKQLNASQLAKMRERLKAAARVCDKCVGPSVAADKKASEKAGGPGGGGKAAPLTVKGEPTKLGTEETEGISDEDLSRATFGDVVGTEKNQHQVNKNAPGKPVNGGAISAMGNGGEAVWHESLIPEDRDVLKRFFK